MARLGHAIADDMDEKERRAGALVQLLLFPDDTRPVSNDVARSAVFFLPAGQRPRDRERRAHSDSGGGANPKAHARGAGRGRHAGTHGRAQAGGDRGKLKRAQALVAKGLTAREAATRVRVGRTAMYEALRA